MEAMILWDMDSVLLELQTEMFANNIITPQDNNGPQQGTVLRFRYALLDRIKNLTDKASKEKQRRKRLMAELRRDEPSMRHRNEPRFDSISNIIYILEKVYRFVRFNQTATRREIYYQNVGLFRHQSSVDKAVNKICKFLNLPQWDLGILSSSKGLIYGPLIIRLKSGETIDCSVQQGGTLVPQDIPHGATYESNARFALIIEKDAAFQTILSSGLNGPLDRCILITGKGYPDMNTRFLVKELSSKLCLPMFVIVDGDPHGIDIFFNYKYGSLAKTYINELLAAPSIYWLGIHPTDVTELRPTAVQPLTSNDKNKAEHLLRRSYVRCNDRLLEQIHVMINRGVKCEIENLTTISNDYLSNVYIPAKISRKKFI